MFFFYNLILIRYNFRTVLRLNCNKNLVCTPQTSVSMCTATKNPLCRERFAVLCARRRLRNTYTYRVGKTQSVRVAPDSSVLLRTLRK